MNYSTSLIAALLICVVANLNLYAQKADTTTFIKLYSNFYLLEKYRSPLTDYQAGYGAFEFGGFSPAIQWAGKKERKYHELELSVLRFKSSEDEIRILKEKEFSLRYEFGKRRLSKNQGKSYWQRGWSLRCFVYETDSEPLLMSGFARFVGYYGFSFSYVPRYTIRVSSRFNVEANLVLGLSISAVHGTSDSPLLTERQRNQWVYSLDLLDELPLRLGVVYRL
jgi:hypothetical protein